VLPAMRSGRVRAFFAFQGPGGESPNATQRGTPWNVPSGCRPWGSRQKQLFPSRSTSPNSGRPLQQCAQIRPHQMRGHRVHDQRRNPADRPPIAVSTTKARTLSRSTERGSTGLFCVFD
jgi:hypothetical protein